LESPKAIFETIAKLSDKNTKFILSFVDSRWNLVLWVLEKLKLKMPKGPNKSN